MIQLAIESTGRTGSIALMRASRVLKSTILPPQRRTAATLAVALQASIDWCDKQNLPIDFVSVADGPGSFTGLRIGVTTAKTLCYAKRWRLTTVDSLAAIAALVFFENPNIEDVLVATNAYRGQVFTGTFNRNSLLPLLASHDQSPVKDSGDAIGGWSAHPDTVTILDQADWITRLSKVHENVALAGDSTIYSNCSDAQFVTRKSADAIGVALLAQCASRHGQWVDPIKLVPRYLRPSAAEEKAGTR